MNISPFPYLICWPDGIYNITFSNSGSVDKVVEDITFSNCFYGQNITETEASYFYSTVDSFTVPANSSKDLKVLYRPYFNQSYRLDLSIIINSTTYTLNLHGMSTSGAVRWVPLTILK